MIYINFEILNQTDFQVEIRSVQSQVQRNTWFDLDAVSSINIMTDTNVTVKMEEEIESVTEAKTLPVKKKVNVLEAMAKYKLKKQQEEEQKMSSSKPKAQSAENQDHYSSKRDCFPFQKNNNKNYSKKKFNGNDRKNGNTNSTSESRLHADNSRKESTIGITEYVHSGDGFSAILKQRYSDFHVHEIDMDGTTIHLTDQTIPAAGPEENKTPSEEELGALTEDQWKSIEEMMNSETPAEVEIDVTERTKEQRVLIHKAIRSKFQGLVSNSVPVEARTIMKIFKGTGKRGEKRRMGPAYTKFVMYKENLSTMEAISTIARVIR